MPVGNTMNVRPPAVDFGVEKTLDKGIAASRLVHLPIQRDRKDIVRRDQRRRQRPRHQEPARIRRVAHRHVTGRVKHTLISQDPARRGDVGALVAQAHGRTETWMAPGAPSPPTDLIAQSTSRRPKRCVVRRLRGNC